VWCPEASVCMPIGSRPFRQRGCADQTFRPAGARRAYSGYRACPSEPNALELRLHFFKYNHTTSLTTIAFQQRDVYDGQKTVKCSESPLLGVHETGSYPAKRFLARSSENLQALRFSPLPRNHPSPPREKRAFINSGSPRGNPHQKPSFRTAFAPRGCDIPFRFSSTAARSRCLSASSYRPQATECVA